MTSPTQPPLDCTAVLMAGGQSIRMGRDKAWLDFGGRPLWQAQLEKLQFAREIFISAREITFVETPSNCRLIFDEANGKGPLAGLHAALKAAAFDRVVLLAVDMPEMTANFLRGLAEEATPEFGVVPEVDGFYQGLAAVYPRIILPGVEDTLTGNDFSFQALNRKLIGLGWMKARQIREPERSLFRNWNRPEE